MNNIAWLRQHQENSTLVYPVTVTMQETRVYLVLEGEYIIHWLYFLKYKH